MREFIKITVFSFVLVGISYLIINFIGETFLHHQIYTIIGFLWMVYTVIHLTYGFLTKNLQIDSPLLPLVGLTLRMLITLFTIVFVVTSGIKDSNLFVINFIAIYFLYLVFEIMALFSNLRRNSSSDQS